MVRKVTQQLKGERNEHTAYKSKRGMKFHGGANQQHGAEWEGYAGAISWVAGCRYAHISLCPFDSVMHFCSGVANERKLRDASTSRSSGNFSHQVEQGEGREAETE